MAKKIKRSLTLAGGLRKDRSGTCFAEALTPLFEGFDEQLAVVFAQLGLKGRMAIAPSSDATANAHLLQTLSQPLQQLAASGKEIRHVQIIIELGLTELDNTILRPAKLASRIKAICDKQFEGVVRWRVRPLRHKVEGSYRYSLIIIVDGYCSGPPALRETRKLRSLARNSIRVRPIMIQPYSAESIGALLERTFDAPDQVYRLIPDKENSANMLLVPSNKVAPPEVLLRVLEAQSQIDLTKTIFGMGYGTTIASNARATITAFQRGRVDGDVVLPGTFDAFVWSHELRTMLGMPAIPVRFDYPSRACATTHRVKASNQRRKGPKKIAPWRRSLSIGDDGHGGEVAPQ